MFFFFFYFGTIMLNGLCLPFAEKCFLKKKNSLMSKTFFVSFCPYQEQWLFLLNVKSVVRDKFALISDVRLPLPDQKAKSPFASNHLEFGGKQSALTYLSRNIFKTKKNEFVCTVCETSSRQKEKKITLVTFSVSKFVISFSSNDLTFNDVLQLNMMLQTNALFNCSSKDAIIVSKLDFLENVFFVFRQK
jgi:hypothetical protein